MISRHTTYHEVREALASPGCVICRLATRSARRFLESVAFECVNDLDLRARLRDTLGFCNRHAWMLLDDAREPFGAGIIYRDVVREAIRLGNTPHGALISRVGCIGCEFHDGAVERYASVLFEHIGESTFTRELARGFGLCLPHARLGFKQGMRGLAPLLDALSVLTEAARDPLWSGPPASSRVEVAGIRAGRSAPRPAPGEELGDPLIALIVGVRPSRWSAADEEMGATVCGACQDEDTKVERAMASPEGSLQGGELACAHHSWLMFDHVGRERARAKFSDIGERLASSIAEIGPEVARDRPLTIGPFTIPTRRSRLAARRIAGAVPAEPDCGFCRLRDGSTQSFASAGEPRGVPMDPDGPLCRPHLARLGNRPDASIAWWSSVANDLDEYIRKNDYRFRDEARGAEQRGPWLAVSAMVGSRGRWAS